MTGFVIKTANGQPIRFTYYSKDAPQTVAAFDAVLPFGLSLLHARVSGSEIWTEHAPRLDIIQENASRFVGPGEVVIGPIRPERNRTCGCMGIYYGDGQGLDACNIFARVVEEDVQLLAALGEKTWKEGTQEVVLSRR